MQIHLEIVSTATSVLPDQSLLVSLVDCLLNVSSLLVELSSDVDVGGGSVHGSTGNETSFDQFMGISSHDFSIFAGTGFTFVCVNDKVSGSVDRSSEVDG